MLRTAWKRGGEVGRGGAAGRGEKVYKLPLLATAQHNHTHVDLRNRVTAFQNALFATPSSSTSTSPHSAAPPSTVKGKLPLRELSIVDGLASPSPSIHRSASSTYNSLRYGPPKARTVRHRCHRGAGTSANHPTELIDANSGRCACQLSVWHFRFPQSPMKVMCLRPSSPLKRSESSPPPSPSSVQYSRKSRISSPRCRAAYVQPILRQRASAIEYYSIYQRRIYHESQDFNRPKLLAVSLRDVLSTAAYAQVVPSSSRLRLLPSIPNQYCNHTLPPVLDLSWKVAPANTPFLTKSFQSLPSCLDNWTTRFGERTFDNLEVDGSIAMHRVPGAASVVLAQGRIRPPLCAYINARRGRWREQASDRLECGLRACSGYSSQLQMTNSLPGVPEELRIKILSFLDVIALARCSMTCKSICETIKNSSLLAYTIQLHLNGLKNTRLSTPHADLLERLLRHRQAWLSLELGEPVTLQLPYGSHGIKLVGAAFAYTNSEHVAEIISLPTSINIGKCTFQNAGRTLVLALTMDPTQDMIALLYNDQTRPSQTDARNICIHIRTMSTDISHPLAHHSGLTVTIQPNPPVGNHPEESSLYVARNILAFTFFDPLRRSEIGGPVLEIWQGVGEEEGYMQDIQEWAVNTKEKAGGGDDLAGELSGTSASGLLGELTPFLFGSLDVVPTRRR
ncbi:hypothetical protein BJ912DRAFT_1049424 [Pholiota molesta]|nr:hypothetical protein BJ912DRAFT_1049424 [Pholiota molesta]